MDLDEIFRALIPDNKVAFENITLDKKRCYEAILIQPKFLLFLNGAEKAKLLSVNEDKIQIGEITISSFKILEEANLHNPDSIKKIKDHLQI